MRNELICNIVILSELYVHLRSVSKTYPYLGANDVYAFFVEKLGFKRKEKLLQKTTIHSICLETSI